MVEMRVAQRFWPHLFVSKPAKFLFSPIAIPGPPTMEENLSSVMPMIFTRKEKKAEKKLQVSPNYFK